jgi:fructokinase
LLTTRMRAFSAASAARSSSRICIGAGSNVVDVFFPVRQLPKPGDKQYFSAESLISAEVVGGVTLNHLAWARELGVPTALLALQGTDSNGEKIRAKLEAMGVATSLIRASPEYTTSVSHILSEEGGERTIVMNPASTSRMTGAVMAKEWASAISFSGMVSTEISQLPLSGVEFLLKAARAAGVPTVLDVDVPPSVATGPARLGSAAELQRCVRGADVVKLTGGAVEELLAVLQPGLKAEGSLEGITQQLADLLHCKLAVITDGSRGSALAVARSAGGRGTAVRVPCFPGVTQVDATGAGDAFLGGLMAALWARGGGSPATAGGATFPTHDEDVARLGRVASAAGAACVEVVGALPVEGVSAARLASLCVDTLPLLAQARALPKGAAHAPTPGSTCPTPSTSSGGGAGTFAASFASDSKVLAAGPGVSEEAVAAALELIARCRAGSNAATGSTLWTTGIGKAGAVAQRAALSLKSIGYRSSFTVRLTLEASLPSYFLFSHKGAHLFTHAYPPHPPPPPSLLLRPACK